MADKTIIGRAERIHFIGDPNMKVPAKIDSGADISSVWATDVHETEDGLQFHLFGPSSEWYSGEQITLKKGEYRSSRIANSFGTKERRCVVKLSVVVKGRELVTEFTLANRSRKIYPILLGRNLLEDNFLVDVTTGEPLIDAEYKKLAKMHVELSEREE